MRRRGRAVVALAAAVSAWLGGGAGAAAATCEKGLSPELEAYLGRRAASSETRVFLEDQLVVTKSVCVMNGRWFALGDDGGARVRAEECEPRRLVERPA